MAERCGALPAVNRARAGARARTRPYSHSLSDDERLYKTAAEREAEAERDPILVFRSFWWTEGILDRHRRCSSLRMRWMKR
jgi:TPP-dependent pyruvate/acetoin dehydrogenase alpha subunit